ncbi:MAG TPA: hypothetical protein VHW23_43280 [Kofleriaceae bacterium]|nr:hypothetical protein [Kofleriaceae bacterium]
MRDRTAIEREIFDAREDLEDSLSRLVRRARNRLAVRARAKHAIREFAREFPNIAAVGVVACVIILLLVRHARRRTG